MPPEDLLTATTDVTADGVLILRLSYRQGLLAVEKSGQAIGQKLCDLYDKAQQDDARVKNASCIVVVTPPKAGGISGGSPLVRGLFGLWEHVVQQRSGRVIVVGFPRDSRYALDALGLPTLPGFYEADSEPQALERLKPGGAP